MAEFSSWDEPLVTDAPKKLSITQRFAQKRMSEHASVSNPSKSSDDFDRSSGNWFRRLATVLLEKLLARKAKLEAKV